MVIGDISEVPPENVLLIKYCISSSDHVFKHILNTILLSYRFEQKLV